MQHELSLIQEKKFLSEPLNLLNNSFWDLFKSGLPDEILKDEKVFKKLKKIYEEIEYLNETIKSREVYRQNNLSNTQHQNNMKEIDEYLLKRINPFLELLEKAEIPFLQPTLNF